MALTGVVFSLVFVMVQFSAIAYSPRLVLWIVRDRVLWPRQVEKMNLSGDGRQDEEADRNRSVPRNRLLCHHRQPRLSPDSGEMGGSCRGIASVTLDADSAIDFEVDEIRGKIGGAGND
jgi:hypothetical protein